MSAAHHAHGDLAYHATGRGYLSGFLLSVILTAIPFFLVMAGVLPQQWTVGVVLGCAAVQVLVHMVFFLHLHPRQEGGWSLLALLFTVVVVVIMLAGSIWVMYHLNSNMMPMMDAETLRNMP